MYRHGSHLLRLLGCQQAGTQALYLGQELVINVLHHEGLLLGDAEHGIFHGNILHQSLGGGLDIGGFVNNDGDIAGAGGDDLLLGGHQQLYHALAAGTDQQGDQGRLHHLLQGLRVGGAGHSGQIGGAAGLNYGAVQQIHSLGGGQLAGGMGIEDDGVAGGDHGNGVAGHGG